MLQKCLTDTANVHGQVEYLTTMKYIHEYLKDDKSKRIPEAGTGTGRYSVTLAKEGYQVDAVELKPVNSLADRQQNRKPFSSCNEVS